MTNSITDARVFLARVMAWPQEHGPTAYVNLHNTFMPKDKSTLRKDKVTGKPKLPWGGRACRSLDEAANTIQWWNGQPSTKDIYFCTSTQAMAETKTGKNGKPWYKAIRAAENAVKAKSLFLDIDLKGGEHGYDTKAELIQALADFLKKTGLPRPSIMVHSGGGYHLYWTLAEPLASQEWMVLAYALAEATKREGLKCDRQCTIDIARVLRIPGTLNHKYDPPREVTFAGTPVEYDYANERIETALEPYKVKVPYTVLHTSMALLPPRTPIQGVSDLEAGIDTNTDPTDIADLIPECGFIADAIADGGKDYANPLWNLTTLISTFTKDGRVDAHRMAHGHPSYTPQETDELYDRKVQEKLVKNLGWPQCASINASGSPACASCKHLPANKSPFNHAVRLQQAYVTPHSLSQGSQAQVTPQGNQTGTALQTPTYVPGIGTQDPDLPDNFLRNPDGTVMYPQAQADGTTTWIPIAEYPMTDPWIQRDPYSLNFTTCVDYKRDIQITIPTRDIGSTELRKVLQNQGFMVRGGPRVMVLLGEFFLSWIKKLQAQKDSVVDSVPYGWLVTNGKKKGFVYGGKLHTPAGEELASNSDEQTTMIYSPVGQRQPWLDAVKIITDQNRPALNAMLAVTFAAPLITFSGHDGLLVSAYSVASGIGKTSTMRIAQAVWGSPKFGIQGVNDTTNSVMHKIGTTRSLPLFWDEIKTAEDGKSFVKLVFQIDKGVDKSRLSQKVAQRSRGTWQTIMLLSTNESMTDHMNAASRTNAASLMRMFEFDVPKPKPGDPGQIDPTVAQRLIGKLNDNYGHIGLEYARFLGANFERIDKDMEKMLSVIGKMVKVKQEERYWITLMGCTLLGAKYANELGFTQIDMNGLKSFLVSTLEDLRKQTAAQPVDMNRTENVVNVLSRYLNEKRSRNTITTDIMYRGRGRPPAGVVTLQGDPTRIDAVHVHIATNEGILRFGQSYLMDWLRANGYMAHVMSKAIVEKLGAKIISAKLGVGTSFVSGTEFVFEVDMKNSELSKFLDV